LPRHLDARQKGVVSKVALLLLPVCVCFSNPPHPSKKQKYPQKKTPPAMHAFGRSFLASRALVRPLSSHASSSLKASYPNIVASLPSPSVGLITLNRPKALNALCDALLDDLLHAARCFDDDENVGCIVITGSDKAFAAGADIKEMQDKTFSQCYSRDMFAEWGGVADVRTPVITAVSGFALGGGCELAMMGDVMVCGESARFGQPEINLGVIPGCGGTQRLIRAVGKSKAMEMCLTGEMMGAQEALSRGLVARVYEDGKVVEGALEMAEKIAGKGRLAAMAVVETVNAAEELSLREGLRLERRAFHGLFATEDQKEGMKAFVEKREAEWKHK